MSNGTLGATPMLASTIVDTLEELEPPLPAEWVPDRSSSVPTSCSASGTGATRHDVRRALRATW
jgi:hypothetical protein